MKPSNISIRVSGPIPEVGKICIDQWLHKKCCISRGTRRYAKFCDLSPLLNLEIVFPALKLTRNCYLNNIFFHENCHFDQKMGLPLSTTNILCLLTKYEINGTSKIPISKLFSDFGKICKCNLCYIQSVTYIQNT